jgi:hypothetical protein
LIHEKRGFFKSMLYMKAIIPFWSPVYTSANLPYKYLGICIMSMILILIAPLHTKYVLEFFYFPIRCHSKNYVTYLTRVRYCVRLWECDPKQSHSLPSWQMYFRNKNAIKTKCDMCFNKGRMKCFEYVTFKSRDLWFPFFFFS